MDFNFRAGQTEYKDDDGSLSLQHFFRKSCAAKINGAKIAFETCDTVQRDKQV